MSELVHLAVAGDVTEAEEMQSLLSSAGIESQLQAEDEADAVVVLVPATQLEAAQEAMLALTEPDDLIADA
jgi:type III secretory pathway lipoprotein EscJ